MFKIVVFSQLRSTFHLEHINDGYEFYIFQSVLRISSPDQLDFHILRWFKVSDKNQDQILRLK